MKQTDFERKRRKPPTRVTVFSELGENRLGRAVTAKRGERSLRTLAKELGEAHTSLTHVEKGRMPRPALFIKLLEWLNVIDPQTAATLMTYAE